MNALTTLLGRANAMLGQAPEGTETVAVRNDRYDKASWSEVSQVPAIQEVSYDLSQTFDYTDDLLEGTFHYLVKSQPEIVPGEEMQVSRKPNQKITVQAKDTPQMEELRSYTRGDAYSSAMGVVAISEKVREYLEHNKELADAAREAQQKADERQQAAQQAAQAASDAAQTMGDMDPNGEGPQTQAQADAAANLEAMLDALAQAQQAEAEAGQALDQQMQAAAPGTRHAVKAGIEEATEDAREEMAAMAAAGVDPGEVKYMSFEERAALAQALSNRRLRDIAPLIGRFRMEAKADRAKRVEHGRDVFVDVELGRDLGRALGSEISKLAASRPRMIRLDTLRRFSEGKLLLRKFEGTEKQGKGTIVAVVDTSGSMMCNIAGAKKSDINLDPSREAWAKAITFVLLDSARAQKRDFYAILFSSSGEQRHYHFPASGAPAIYERNGVTPIKFNVPIKGNLDMAVTLDLIGFMFNGGTDFEQPLTQALKVIERRFDSNGKPKADIAFITDDDGTVSPKFMGEYLRVKDKVGVRTFGFAVGCTAGNTLTSVSDNVRSLTDLADTREVQDVFRSI